PPRPPPPTLLPYTTLFRSRPRRRRTIPAGSPSTYTKPARCAQRRVSAYNSSRSSTVTSPLRRLRAVRRSRSLLEQRRAACVAARSEEHTSELQSPYDLVCR